MKLNSLLLAALLLATPFVPAADAPPEDQPATKETVTNMGPLSHSTAPNEVRFVVFGDSQFGSPPIFERMVHEANLLRPHFVVTVGDMINGYTDDVPTLRREWVRYKNQIAPLSMPFFPVPGNHDVVTQESHNVYADVWGPERFVYSFGFEKSHFIVLDSFQPGEHDQIADWQIEWLANDLAEFAEAHGGEHSPDLEDASIFIFLHSPLWRYSEDRAGRQDWDAIHQLLLQYPVRMVAGGHTHEYVWENRDGIDYVVLNSTGGIGGTFDRAGFMRSFLHVSVIEGSDVRVAVVQTDSILPIDTVNSQERATLPSYLVAGGTLRLDHWEEGAPLEETITVPLANRANAERTFHLQWERTKAAAGITIEPSETWVEMDPKGYASATFTMKADQTPARSAMPRLRVEATDEFRTGVVSREWEEHYRDARSRDDGSWGSEIRLEENRTLDGRFSLTVPPRTVAKRWTGEMTLDGKLDETAWKTAAVVDDFKHSGGTKSEDEFTVRYLYDDEYLYIGAWMAEPNPENLKANAGGDIPLTWNDDDLELFFDPNETRSQYSRLFINSVGTRFNSMPRHIADKYFESDYESAIHIGDDHWAVEMMVPWSDIYEAKPPKSGTTWGIDVWRHRQQASPTRQWWAVGSYRPGYYATLEFE